MRTWTWGQDSLPDRIVGNKIANVYTLLNIKIVQGKKKDKDDKSAATEGETYKIGEFWTEGFILIKVAVYCSYSYSLASIYTYIYIYIYI